jgi:hypothetical protein
MDVHENLSMLSPPGEQDVIPRRRTPDAPMTPCPTGYDELVKK